MLLNVVDMASSVSLTLFMSYPADRAIDGEITNIRSSKCLPQSLLWQVGFLCTVHVSQPIAQTSLILVNECILHQLAEDNIKHVPQVKQGHVECLVFMSNMTSCSFFEN